MTTVDKLQFAQQLLNQGYISQVTYEKIITGLYLIESDKKEVLHSVSI
jgi:hypothetical protein